jgi:hypothetical protein
MPVSFLDVLLDGHFALTPRPEPVAGDLRRAWGIALLVLILGKSRGKRASLQKLHFLGHSARTRQSRQEVQEVFAGERRSSDLVVRVEPWLNRALAFAKGAGLIELEKGKSAKLTDAGLKACEVLNEQSSMCAEEKAFLEAVSGKATEAAVDKIMRMELAL